MKKGYKVKLKCDTCNHTINFDSSKAIRSTDKWNSSGGFEWVGGFFGHYEAITEHMETTCEDFICPKRGSKVDWRIVESVKVGETRIPWHG